ncbi:Zn-dependent hydrolase [Pseudomonas gingeri NCPPB 3146 = LMG 5327]|uniref:Zn-dependent hydrolase n=2 Tax=Pseudomonas gingeri TaxID=117681 RepID=A0A7Y7Y481_9PSED|nr:MULTISPECIES: Zn-dependent hydrolase [Pseudomonas]NVZ27770.1 Zn-dependent hydrolase [Pseudomonas gingeri]NWA02554.1 Zn-dependent hydrolase [Pseudomonas gingeri]NWA12273.1 Zn-dependent hydrolase [Pseudomonas gingeri]NWA57321.1 Zn-dependent hydrolase [Pseudomonas gingeri]NWA93664.1 Zn-dependent hydrolase [Pseudomonas gingeri]
MNSLWQAQASRIFADIAELSRDPKEGITRESYGPGESAAIAYLCDYALARGLEVNRDRAGNVIFQRRDDSGLPAIWYGSHLDSVPQGGNYDGLAGVVAGLLCLCRLDQEQVRTAWPFRVLGLRGEESAWYGKSYIGSRAVMGGLTGEDLQRVNRFSQKSLGDALQSVGADLDAIRRQQWLIEREQFAGYLEVHIEQAESLEKAGQAIGIVPGIRGNLRHNRVRCLGEDGHSGAVSREDRHDSVFAVSELVARIDECWEQWLAAGQDLVVTVGTLGTNSAHHAVSRIPGEVSFSLEIRSLQQPTLERFHALILHEVRLIEARRRVIFEFDERVDTAPAAMHQPWVELFSRLTREQGWAGMQTPSGAGHDAAVFANAGIPSAMLFIRNQHGSHNPHEAMDVDDFVRATEVLYLASQELNP